MSQLTIDLKRGVVVYAWKEDKHVPSFIPGVYEIRTDRQEVSNAIPPLHERISAWDTLVQLAIWHKSIGSKVLIIWKT